MAGGSWAVVAVSSDEEWKRFAGELSDEVPELKDPAFETLAGRLEKQESLDQLLGGLFRSYEAKDIAQRIQNIGISAAKVHSTWDTLYDNEQIKALSYFKKIDLEKNGLEPEYFLVTGPLIHSEKGDPEVYEQGPAFAKDNELIIKDMLGFDDAFYESCISEHVFS